MSSRLLVLIHGQLAALALAALLHPALMLRRGQPLSRGRRWATLGAALLATATFATGLLLYDDYRALVRRRLFALSSSAGFFFETKEHLAVAALALALGGAVAALVAPPSARPLRRAAAASFLASAILLLAALLIGLGLATLEPMP